MTKQRAEYAVDLTGAARRDLIRINTRRVIERLDEAIQSFAADPRPPGAKKLTAQQEYRYRVGDYRILYEIDDAARSILVTRIRHR
ncbi:MAG: type II toxin-antitoxin system RelE/ParE family toxin [Thermoguttaceae bacterium]